MAKQKKIKSEKSFLLALFIPLVVALTIFTIAFIKFGPNAHPDWKTFGTPKNNIMFRYPPTWHIADNSYGADARFTNYGDIFIEGNCKNETNCEELGFILEKPLHPFADDTNAMKYILDNYQLDCYSNTINNKKIGNANGFVIEYSPLSTEKCKNGVPTFGISGTKYIVSARNLLYTIDFSNTGAASPSKIDNEKVIQDVLNSMRFKK